MSAPEAPPAGDSAAQSAHSNHLVERLKTERTAWSGILAWWRLALKELRETLRDRRTIATLVFMPILVYPLLGITFHKFLFAQLADQPITEVDVALATAEDAALFKEAFSHGNRLLGREIDPTRPLPPKAGELPDPQLRLLFPNPNAPAANIIHAVENGVADLGIEVERLQRPRRLRFTLIGRGQSPLSRDARTFVVERLRAVNDEFVKLYLAQQQPPAPLPMSWDETLLPGSRPPSFSLATLVPLVLILMTVTGAVYPAIDLTAGERERGTLEALIAAPVSRTRVLLAKYVAVVTVALMTAVVNLSAMVATAYATGFEQLLFGQQGLTPWLLIAVFGLLAVFAGFFAAVILALTSVARSFKEAQAYLIPLMLLSMAPGILALLPGLKLTAGWALVPLANMVLVTRDLLDGRGSGPMMAIALVANGLWTAVALTLATRVFGTDAVLYGASGSWREVLRRPVSASSALTLNHGLIGLSVLFPAFILLSSVPGRFADWSINARLTANATVLIVLFALWPMALAAYQRVAWRSAFGLAAPSWLAFLAAVLAGLSLWPLAYEIEVSLISAERLRALVEIAKPIQDDLGRTPLLWKLATLAIVPAICEELCFRGFLFRAFRSAMGPAATIVVTATLFGMFHVLVRDALLFERFPPTACLGLVLGWLAHRTGSVWPGMALHVINNAFVLLLPTLQPWLGNWAAAVEQHTHLPIMVLAIATVTLTASAVALERGSGRARRECE